jgi:N-acylglucosamine 2-epimerase
MAMFFSVTREGRPLRKRRYLFSEAFATIALAAYGKAADDAAIRRQALDRSGSRCAITGTWPERR